MIKRIERNDQVDNDETLKCRNACLLQFNTLGSSVRDKETDYIMSLFIPSLLRKSLFPV